MMSALKFSNRLPPKMNNEHFEQDQDMTDYVTETLSWAMGQMMTLIEEGMHDEAIALGDEFLAWANESDKEVMYCYCTKEEN